MSFFSARRDEAMYRCEPVWSQRLLGMHAGVAQLVELQPSKLDVASSNLVARSTFIRRVNNDTGRKLRLFGPT